MIPLGAPLFGVFNTPDEWVRVIKAEGWTATYYPPVDVKDRTLVQAYASAAKQAGIVISEVGVWNNPISPHADERTLAVAACKEKLALADELGARCCVNIAGSRNPKYWCGPHKDNLTAETFDMIVQVTREIIDAVKPTRTFYTLEAMPWICPDTVDHYVDVIKAIDRPSFAVHLDPVNFVVCPRIYFDTTAMIRECFAKLGPYIKSCHAKDIYLQEDPVSVRFDEVRPGLGVLDYATFLKELAKLGDVPLMLEHLPDAEQYRLAGQHIRSVAKQVGVVIG